MLRFILLLGLLPLFSLQLRAQNTDEALPRHYSDSEKALLPFIKPVLKPSFGNSNPPVKPVRTMAEWEELQALLITWRTHPTILTEIVRAARKECRVLIACSSQSTVTSAKNTLQTAGVDISSNVEFIVTPNNSIWVRDYGPNCVYSEEVDSLYFIDWRYNRTTRPADDTLAVAVAKYLNVPLYNTNKAPNDMVHTGGNFMSDGLHNAFSSRLILDENAPGNAYGASVKDEAQINGIMADYMGIQRYIKMEKLPYDEIHHIDMHMKLLDEETLLVGKYPEGIADGPQIEANIQYVLSNYKSAFGTPFKQVRIPMPPDANNRFPDQGGDYRTYANAVFVNKTVIVPFYDQKYDTTAQRIWQEALPGYNIVGIDCNAIIPSLGAIHCITKEIGVSDPLLIVHQELPCTDGLPVGFRVLASIHHRTGITQALIRYRTNPAQAWQWVEMVPNPLDTVFNYVGYIPQQPAGSTIEYAIEAKAVSGKIMSRPMAGAWSFCVLPSTSTENPTLPQVEDIFPNPARAITCIPVQNERPTRADLKILNALGQTVEVLFSGQLPAGTSRYFLDAATYKPGAYFVELRTPQGRVVRKLLVQ